MLQYGKIVTERREQDHEKIDCEFEIHIATLLCTNRLIRGVIVLSSL